MLTYIVDLFESKLNKIKTEVIQMFRRIFIVLSVFVVCLLLSISTNSHCYAYINKNITVYSNGNKVTYDIQPQIINERAMLPIRKTVETLGAKVEWNQESETVTIIKNDTVVTFTIGEKYIYVNGEQKSIDTPSSIVNGRTLVPIRFLAEAFAYKVSWVNETRSIYISDSTVLQIPILMYHHFAIDKTTSIIVHPDLFEKQMTFLKENGYNTITTTELLNYIEGNIELPDKPILITMDDGYESNYTYAYPILKKLNMKATVFIIGERLREHSNDPIRFDIPRLSWDEAKEMYDSGVFDIQSHTYNMHNKGKVKRGFERGVITEPIYINGQLETNAAYEKRVLSDILYSKQQIEEKVGNKVVALCYPYGDYSDQSESLIKEAGYKMSLTIQPGVNIKTNGAYKLNRINVPGWFSPEQILTEIDKY
jgi:peptidoglycan/xylan/chitin deacetylase (PgdA/CDA1 family)